ncbi:MAG: hypothetical protein GX025_09465 [Clostridiales bacterium]|nr:hypothetical protein [Clostridiales bacterium]
MKKRGAAIILALLMLLPLGSTVRADDTGVCFTAVGDKLLELSSMASFSGGNTYVPASVFSYFGINYNYFNSDATALLYTDSKQVFFEMNTGKSYDSMETELYASAIFRNGQVYVPVSWTCSYFGLFYSYISGSGSGDIVRVKNGGEVLSDSQFINAAASLMKSRFSEYFGAVDPVTPSPTPSPSPSPEQEDRRDTYVFLSFNGAPESWLLDILDKYSYSANFFITPSQAGENGDILRRAYGTGHNIGVYCDKEPESEFDNAADAIFSALQVYPSFLSSPASGFELISNFSQERGLAAFSPTYAMAKGESYTAISSKLETAGGYISISMPAGEESKNEVSALIQYLFSKKFTVLPLLETYI